MTTLPRPSIALLRGRLFPASPGNDSLLIQGDTIRRIGSAEDIASAAPPGAQIYDLDGRIASVGFQDAHMHFHSMGVRSARPSLSGARSLEEAIEILRSSAEGARSEILVAERWDEAKWTPPERPSRARLDAALPNRAVILRRVCGHAAAANTTALRWLEEKWGTHGIDFESGTLLEHPILALDELLPHSREEEDEALDAAAALCFSYGVTTASDFPRRSSLRAYASRLERRPLPLPVHAYLIDPEDEWRSLLRGTMDTLRVQGIKVFADGSIGARTAAVFEDYADRPGARGDLLLDASSILTTIQAAHASGLAVAVHAIGDRAIAEVLRAFTSVPEGERARYRDRIEHFEIPRRGDPATLARLGVRVCMQPNFVAEWGMAGGMYERALGVHRAGAMNPLRSVLRAGCALFFGSDGMPLSPLYGIRAALTHPVEEERLDVHEAHALYTRAPAEAFGETRTGLLREGGIADVAVLPREFSWETALPATTVDLTIAAGRIVHQSTLMAPLAARGESH